MIRYVTQGEAKLKRYVSLQMGEEVKNDQNYFWTAQRVFSCKKGDFVIRTQISYLAPNNAT